MSARASTTHEGPVRTIEAAPDKAVRPAPRGKDVARALGSAMIGNWFELFDFIIYGYFAAQIGKAMFPPPIR